MPALGSSLVRKMRRLAAAHAAYPGVPPEDPMEVLAWYESGGAATTATAPVVSRMSRRAFLRRSAAVGAGAVGASVLGWRGARPVRAGDGHVVIIGAGLAGLACAYRLAQHGVASTLYEARHRMGGRCWTVRAFDHHQTAEHGGQFIDTRHHQIRSLAKELGLKFVDTEDQSFPAGDRSPIWIDGALRSEQRVFRDFGIFFRRLKADYERVGSYFYDEAGPAAVRFDRMTVNEYLDETIPGGLTSLLGQAIERSNTGFWGLDGENLSAINLFEFYLYPYPGADERYRVVNGNDRIVEGLAESLPPGTIQAEQPLQAIWTQSDGRIGLRLGGVRADVTADLVVLALPFTVLRDLDYSGLRLSRKRTRAIETLAMGTNSKLQLQLNRSFKSLDWTGSFRSDRPEFGTWDSTYGQSNPAPRSPVLTIYTGGHAGASYPTDRPHGLAPSGIVDNALDAIARGIEGIHDAYGGVAYLDSWVDDPWVHGSYAGFAPGHYTDFWGYLHKPEGPVLFAGEHTSTHSQGYLNGGVESGERAAHQVLRRLGIRGAA
jgi:monoamine oxidase